MNATVPNPNRRISIFIDSGGGYSLTNMGDVAMLQVAVSRIAKLWPDASINVVTEVPDRLSLYSPNARPITASGRKGWFQKGGIFGMRFYRLVPGPASFQVMELERKLLRRWPSLARAIIQFRGKLRPTDSVDVDTYLDALLASDLVIITGCGGFNDTFPNFAMTGLDVLAMASRRGIRTAMFGQGFGPIRDPAIWVRAKAVLPSVDMIYCRENRAGVPLLYSLGVSPNRVMTTGDDAIELAYTARGEEPGNGIGVNLRVCAARPMSGRTHRFIDYSGVDLSVLERIRPVLHEVARKHGAPLIPVPIARSNSESDATSIRQILAGYNDESDGGQNLDSPLKVIRQIGCCRVVVTGSYHGAVFALSQGIPTVGLAKSAYYVDKFLGLADQFGLGCQTIFLDDEQLCKKLAEAIDFAWRSAEDVKAPLLEAAKRQIELGHDAYRRVYDLVMAEKTVAYSLHQLNAINIKKKAKVANA